MNELDDARARMHELEDDVSRHERDDVTYAQVVRELLDLEDVPLEHVEHVLAQEARRATRLTIRVAHHHKQTPTMLAAASVGIVQGITLAEALWRLREEATEPEGGSTVSSTDTIHARCGCGEVFSAPADAAEHREATGHTTWAIPLSWLRQADVLAPEAFFEWAARVGKVST